MENQTLGIENPAPALQEESVNLRHYWHVILERRWLVITAFVSIFALSLIYLFKATPIYQADTRLQIDREVDNLLRLEGLTLGTSAEEATYLQTQYKNLMSRALIQSVVTQLKLDKDERYARKLDVVKAVADDISIVPIRLTRLVDVKVEHPDKKKAALIANTLANEFISQYADQKIKAARDIAAKLETEASTEQEKLAEAEQALARYAQEHNQVSFEETDNIVLQSLRQAKADHAKAQADAEAAEQVVQSAAAALAEGKDIATIPQVANNVYIQSLRRDLAVAEAEFAELKKRYKSKFPLYTQAEEKVASLQNSITEQAQSVIAALHHQAEDSRAIEKRLDLLVEKYQQDQLDLQQKQIEYDVLKRKAEAADMLFKTVLARMKETDLTGRNRMSNISVVYPAVVPLKPVKPRVILTIFLGIVGGLGIAIGLAFFVNYLDDSIKNQEDIETHLRLPFLGYIPNIKTNSVVERDLQAHLHPQSNAAEAFRTVRASISLAHKPDQVRVLSVTSTIPSEGKSLVASNLAVVIAQTGLKTLLVDSDLRRPSVHKAYQLHSPTGLSSYLTREVDQLDPIIHHTEVPNLDVVCCGAVPSTPSELICSTRMAEFVQGVRGRYDRIILDSPPISAVSDPLMIATLADGVVFVTKFNKIRREHARRSIQRLQDGGIHTVGVVLNDIDFEGKDSYYYSYYYYQNRYYASHYRNAGARSKTDKEKSPELVQERNGD